jgi:hypothetical protein
MTLKPRQLVKFWDNVEKGEGCWAWRGGKRRDGYGFYNNMLVRNVVYFLVKQIERTKDMRLSNTCGNKQCINPDHMTLDYYRPVKEQHKKRLNWVHGGAHCPVCAEIKPKTKEHWIYDEARHIQKCRACVEKSIAELPKITTDSTSYAKWDQ